jgi:hypothetical protein
MGSPDLQVVAEGDLPSGEHWVLKAGRTPEDFSTFLETVHPDGRRDRGGMRGPALYAGSLLNTFTGGSGGGLRGVLARADPRVARVRVNLTGGQHVELTPLGAEAGLGVVFFVALLPRTAELASITALGDDGQVLEPQDLRFHEAQWRGFLGRDAPESKNPEG